MKISPYQKTIFKSKLKKIETMTLRCNNCYYIPRFKLNFESQNLLIICDKCNKNFKEENKIFQIDSSAFIRLFLEGTKCKICKKNDNHLYLDDISNSIICDSCIHENNIKFKDGDKNYIYDDSKISNYQFNLNGNISLDLDEFEKPLSPTIIKKFPHLLLSKKELDDLKIELNKLEEKCNQNYNSNDEEFDEYWTSTNSIIDVYPFIFFCISFTRSLIYTYEDMIKNNFLNYNIIYNIRKIKINKDNIESNLIPFYNVCINKYFLDERDKNKLNDEYTHEKIMKLINEKGIKDGDNYRCNISENNDLIFIFYEQWQQPFFQIFGLEPFDEIYIDENKQSKLTSKFPVLNFLNYIFQINDNNNSIIIYTYSIIKEFRNKIEFFEYQKIELNELYNSYKDHEIYSDNKTNKVYFFLKNLKKIIVLTKNENKNKFDEKIYKIEHLFNSNNIYKFSDNIMYIFRENDFVEINLENNKERSINISKGKLGNFIDFDDLNIILVCSLNDEKYFFAFVNKKTFKLEKEKYYFETKNNNKRDFFKIDNNYIFYAGYIFYVTEDKRIIAINYCYINPNIKFNGCFKKDGKIYFLLIELIRYSLSLRSYGMILFQLKNPNEYNKYSELSKFNKYKFHCDKLPVRRFEIFNNFRKKILTCPYCSLIPYFNINYYIQINCYLHSISGNFYENYKNIYDIEDFLYYYNDLDSPICYYCGTQNNLFIVVKLKYEGNNIIYTCKNCKNNYYKTKYNKEFLKLIDINNPDKCIHHNQDLNIRNLCDECIKEDEELVKEIKKEKDEELDSEDEACIERIKIYKIHHLNEEFNYIHLSSIQEINHEEEKLEDILYTDKEIEELKSKIKIIETKINNYYNNKANEIQLNPEKYEYFKFLYFNINIYYSFIYTYEYFSKKKCLNYAIVSNLRKIKLIPNFNIDKKELFFINISMSRFLRGEIKRKDNEVLDLYEKMPYNYYINKIDSQTDGILLFKKNVEIGEEYDFNGYNNIYIYSNIQIEKSNLNEILTKEFHENYNNMILINHSNLICIFDEKGIYIYSYKLHF